MEYCILYNARVFLKIDLSKHKLHAFVQRMCIIYNGNNVHEMIVTEQRMIPTHKPFLYIGSCIVNRNANGDALKNTLLKAFRPI